MLLVSHDDALLAKESHGDHNQTLSMKRERVQGFLGFFPNSLLS